MKWKWWLQLRNMKLMRKLTLVYGIIIGIACGLALGALHVSFQIYDHRLYEKSQQELDFFTQKMNDSLNSVEQLSYTLAMDENIQRQIQKAKTFPYMSADYLYEMSKVRQMVSAKMNNYAVVKNVIYTDQKKLTISVGMDCGEIEQEKAFFRQADQKMGGYVYRSPTKNYPYLLSGRNCLSYLDASLAYMGTFLLTSDISQMIADKVKELQTPHSILFVYAQGGMVYQPEQPQLLQFLPKEVNQQGYDVIVCDGKKYLMCYRKAEKNGWIYVNFVPYSEILGQAMALRYWLMIGFFMIFAASFLLLKRLSGTVTRPLGQLVESIKIVETGDFQRANTVLGTEMYADEAGVLSHEFQIMLQKINDLIHENYEKKLLLNETKYRMLQAQINPHFLYNTLNTLNWMVEAKRNQDAEKVIIHLGELLRASFSKKPLTTVAADVNLVRSYIAIQEYRYRSRVTFSIETQGAMDCYRIPHMTLQPLVENAICHGADQSVKPCTITVRVWEQEDGMVLQVADTGPGISPEKLEQVRNFTVKPQGNGIGLQNICERLQMACEGSAFAIDSKPGVGTTVTIQIPKKESKPCINF